MSQKLTLLDDSTDSEIELTINEDYAKNYNRWRKGEELQKYKDLMKDEEDSESSSESEEVDEEFDEEFFRALSLIKGKDPRLYDKNFQLFKEKHLTKKSKTEKQKPIYLKDYERKLVLEKGGRFSDEDENENIPEKITTYNEEQENLKKSFKEAIGDSDHSDIDDLLQVRTKTKKEEEDEEADYVKWLKGEETEIAEDLKKDMSYLRNYWNDPNLDEGEKFLRDYILNKRYLDKDDSEIPTYDEITSGMLSDDEKMVEEQEKFEHKYNFRFEEPDEEFIKRYPRTVGDSLRKVDNRRKEKREEKAERKRKEREQRREELKRLKALKRKEIEEKFMKLKEISGQDEINLKESDIESDFDPDKHDQRMNEMFNEEYYQVEEQQKPEFPYDEELDSENWNAWAGEKIIEENEDDDNLSDKDVNSDTHKELVANPKDEFVNEMINATRPKKRLKKKSLFAKIISQSKPLYDPDGKSFEDYLDEYYKLDYEDVVGDMPVRYKYRKVIPNDFGLTVDEILAADDKELNRWCSIKKTCQYRNDDEELYDVQAFRKKAQIPHIKQKFLASVYAPKHDDDGNSNVLDCENIKKKKTNNDMINNIGNSEREDIESFQVPESEDVTQVNDQEFDTSLKKLKKKSKKKKKKQLDISNSETSELTNSTQIKNSDKNKCNSESSVFENVEQPTEQQMKKSKKKNRKGKQNMSGSEVESPKMLSETAYQNSDGDETPASIESNSHKSTKKKRKHSDDTSEISGFKGVHSDDTRKGKQNMSGSEVESPKMLSENAYQNSDGDETPASIESSHKSTKKKRKHSDDASEISGFKGVHSDDTSENSSPKLKKRRLSEPKTTNSNIVLKTSVSEDTSLVPSKKKKKKKKKKRKESSNSSNAQQNTSNFYIKYKNSKDKHEDKRLGLSDERLAAYGINPKKFKNKIIYSNK